MRKSQVMLIQCGTSSKSLCASTITDFNTADMHNKLLCFFVLFFIKRGNNGFLNICRYLNIYVGMPDVEESFNVTRPVSPHEVRVVCVSAVKYEPLFTVL